MCNFALQATRRRYRDNYKRYGNQATSLNVAPSRTQKKTPPKRRRFHNIIK